MSNAVSMNQAQISVARQQLDQIEQEGRDAVTLINAAQPTQAAGAATPANVGAGVGTHVSFTA